MSELLPLEAALETVFPKGGPALSTAQTAAKAGELNAVKFKGRWYAKREDIEEWFEANGLRGQQRNRHISTSGKEKADPQFGLSETERKSIAQAALMRTLKGPRERSRSTPPVSTPPIRESATLLKFQSQKS